MTSEAAGLLRRTARDAFGYPDLRPFQLEPMLALVEGRDALVVAPTGSGKSAIYQVPALLRDGPTLVISPLIALQRDQVGRLGEPARGGAVAANSAQGRAVTTAALERVRAGAVEFLFLAPEQLRSPGIAEVVRSAGVSLLVVDEAHCVAAWGHDFRPDYLRVGQFAETIGRPPIVALTATASPPVRAEITQRLGLRDPHLTVTGFDRPNLTLAVERHASAEAKDEAVVLRAAAEAKPGLVYVATRARAEQLAGAIAELGLRAAAYHAGLPAARRHEVQAAFTDGSADVVVATSAFGMGIDKADVRFVLHADPADSLDSYYQEIGRAGRDGKPALAALYYRPEDVGVRRFFAGGAPPRAALRRVAALMAAADRPVGLAELAAAAKVSLPRAITLVDLLVSAGALDTAADQTIRAAPGAPAPGEAAAAAAAGYERWVALNASRVTMMQEYAETLGCRRQLLLAAFGDTLAEPCGACDTCASGSALQVAEAQRAAGADRQVGFAVDSRVRHATWGEGMVMRDEGDRVVVLFDEVGYRTLSLQAIAGTGLLTAV